MDLSAPFTGTLLLPDKLLPHGDSPVELPDGRMVAKINWNILAWGSFTILDPAGQEIAAGKVTGLTQRTYEISGADGGTVLRLELGWRGAAGRSTLSLPDGGELTLKGATFRRRWSILDGGDAEVATIIGTSGAFSLRKDAYAFELRQPVLSVVQAVAAAQSLREAVKSARQTTRSRAQARNRARRR
jgi:hypothetical protein